MKRILLLSLLIHATSNCIDINIKQRVKDCIETIGVKCAEIRHYLCTLTLVKKLCKNVYCQEQSDKSDFILTATLVEDNCWQISLLNIYQLKFFKEKYFPQETAQISQQDFKFIQEIASQQLALVKNDQKFIISLDANKCIEVNCEDNLDHAFLIKNKDINSLNEKIFQVDE